MREVEDYKRKFLVVVDDSEECGRAVAFAAYRVRRTGGTIVFLAVIDSADFQQWMGVEEVMRAEALEEAERLLDTRIAEVRKIGDIQIETVIREGRPAEAVEALIAEDKGIGILVIPAGLGDKGPGPLVTHFAAHTRLHILVTIVPGAMTVEEIEAVA